MLKQVHAYDGLGQLVASVRSQGAGDATPTASNAHAWQEQAVWRYAYDAQQRRLLAQQGDQGQGVANQTETTSTARSAFVGDSARLTLSDQASAYNANGQPERWGERAYTWDALGRLSEVQDKGTPLARYTYDHRGLRVSKSLGQGADPHTTYTPHTTHTLYSEDHSPQAELDALQYAAHAVALNEHRSLFPLESIESSYRNPGFDSNRIERGFIGGHSDIGGGYMSHPG